MYQYWYIFGKRASTHYRVVY